MPHKTIDNRKPNLRQYNCTKKKHDSLEDARFFQMRITNDKPFWVYYCNICDKYHVSLHGLPKSILNTFAHMVRNNYPDVTHVETKTNNKKIFDVEYQGEVFRVLYNNLSKKVKVIG